MKVPQVYRFVLSDEEFRRAWLREYYRRPGSKVIRIALGPAFVLVGAFLLRSPELFNRAMGVATVLLGLWYAFKPLIAARVLTRRRREARRADVELEVTLHRAGVRIDDGRIKTELPWVEIRSAGRSREYFWYELRGGSRATIPTRVVDEPAELEALLRAETRWVG